LRCYPLFGVAHRITSEDVTIPDGSVTYKKGTVLCFNYSIYHSMGYTNPSEFNPDRWNDLSKSDSNFMPFGVAANRPCPAQKLAMVLMKSIAKVAVEHCFFASSVVHSRSLPGKGLCLIASKKSIPSSLSLALLMTTFKIIDTAEALTISVKQLVFGTIMLLQAQKMRMAQTFMEKWRSQTIGQSNPFSDTSTAKAL